MKSYLLDRSQQVFHNNCYSSELIAKRGVPQGSILGPLLFVIYVNDLPAYMNLNNINECELTTIMYADDTSFVIKTKKCLDTPQIAAELLEDAQQWFTQNELFLNENKTIITNFEIKQNARNENIKFLGVCVDSCLSWQYHITYLSSKLSRVVFAVRRISMLAGEKAALTTYYALFNSVLEYGILTWGNAAQYALQKIFIIQKAAVRGIVQANYSISCKPLFLKLNIMSLYSLIIYHNLIYTKNNIGNFPVHSNVHTYDTRNQNKIIQPHTRLHKSTVLGIRLYNSLPVDIRQMNKHLFKKTLKKMITENCLYSTQEFYSIQYNM